MKNFYCRHSWEKREKKKKKFCDTLEKYFILALYDKERVSETWKKKILNYRLYQHLD